MSSTKRPFHADLVSSDDEEEPRRKKTTLSQSTRDDWAEASSEVTTTQARDADYENFLETFKQYGVVDTKVVGLRYYTGRATAGEMIMVRREPSNPYDSNALRIDNVMGQQIGHIGRTNAAKLAPLMDDRSIIVEGQLTGEKGVFDMPIALRIFGTSDVEGQAALKQRLLDARLPINSLRQEERERKQRDNEASKAEAKRRQQALKKAAAQARGVRRTGSKATEPDEQQRDAQWAGLSANGDEQISGPDMEQILESAVQFDPREIGQVVDKYGAGEESLSQLPSAVQPKGISTKLLPYQLQGLTWMIDRENPTLPLRGSTDTVQLWKTNAKDGSHTNIATQFTTSNPSLASGGILADDMGLGKTLQILALLMSDYQVKEPTLIVSPLSVMSNWVQQAEAHVGQETPLKVLTYHGASKSHKPWDLQSYDLVVTTYQTMALEYLPGGSKSNPKRVPRSSGLYSINWRRVVLDEGHNIRNAKTKMSQAAYALQSRSRWVLTGTPIVNSLKDLYSHIKFLRMSGGLGQQEIFNAALIRPLNYGHPEGKMLLQALMSTLCLRRMKDMKFIDLKLPALSSHRYSVKFLSHEKEKYDAFEAEAKGLLIQYQTRKNAKGENSYSHLLEVLLRMRQTCNHWKLCGDRANNLLALLEQNKKVKLTPENLRALQDLLQLSIDSQEDCPICLDALRDPVITPCSHIYGRDCIERVIATQHKCPMCRAELADDSELVAPAEEHAPQPSIDTDNSSSKIEALLDILRASRKKNPTTKTVVFSQFTSFLNVIQHQVQAHGFKYCRLDGAMNASKRDEAMASLAQDPECTIMLASLSVCSVGLNLVAANQVILADSWWAPAIEDQAVDRVYRLGQKRDTTVFRLVMEGSIEERVLDIQGEKRRLMATAFGEKNVRRGEQSARLADVEKLLGGS